MSAVSLTAVGQLKGQTAPYSLASITGTVYDSAGTAFTIPSPKSLVFFRSKTFTLPVNTVIFSGPTSPGVSAFGSHTQINMSPDGKTLSWVNAYSSCNVLLINGNSVGIWMNISVNVNNNSYCIMIFNGSNIYNFNSCSGTFINYTRLANNPWPAVMLTAPYNCVFLSSDNISIYLTNGLPGNQQQLFIGNNLTMNAALDTFSVSVTITNSPTYSTTFTR
jgi:hypothetical protein